MALIALGSNAMARNLTDKPDRNDIKQMATPIAAGVGLGALLLLIAIFVQ